MYVTIGSKKEAKILSKSIIKNNLAKCINISGKMNAIFRWNKKIIQSGEYALFIKCSSKNCENLISIIKENHPYENPCIIVLPIETGSNKFIQWIKS